MRLFGFLNIHSNYSLLRGVSDVSKLVKKAKENGADAVAITDIKNLYGVIPFYSECIKEGIKPIIGTTLLLNTNGNDYSKIILLAKNIDGYKNLMNIITDMNFKNSTNSQGLFVTMEDIKKHSSNLIFIIPTINNHLTKTQSNSEIEKELNTIKEIFGDNFYVGLYTNSENTEVDKMLVKIKSIADKFKIKTIPLPLIYYSDKEDKDARDVLFNIQRTNKSILEEEKFNADMSIPSREEIEKSVDEQSLKNLSNIINDIDIKLEIGTSNWVFPTPKIKTNYDEDLREKTYEGIKKRNIELTPKVKDRIELELKVISNKRYSQYFLTVIDVVEYMHNIKILTNTRGSAAGSLVSYLTGVTNVNPLEYDLPFERFLNPFRPSAPDIDLDIADNRRDEVIQYLIKTFGKQNIAQIGTFGTMKARAAVRDVARALGYSYITGDRIAKSIPLGKQGANMYIDKALEESVDLKNLYENEPDAKIIIDTAKKIEGSPRHISIHAAGVIITPDNVTNYTPLEIDSKEHKKVITQYDMNTLEDIGVLKFDFLGLTNLTILAESIDLIKKTKGIDINIENIPLNDKKTYDMLSNALTVGVFQLGGDGMKSVIKKIKPKNISDISATIALYRPGPMAVIDEFVKRKDGDKEIKYFHPKMEKYLKSTYGLLVYQDDLLFTAIELGGYDWKEIDVFRKAIGKKIYELMHKAEIEFKEKIQENSKLSEDQAQYIWNLFEPFKAYGFNKAHAISYANLAYKTAYIKANFPAEYLAVHLTAESGNFDNISELIYESKKMGIKILPPDINKSSKDFSPEIKDNSNFIRFGLNSIKNLGKNTVDFIIEEKNKKEFATLSDFLIRVGKSGTLTRRSIDALIKTGTFDNFENRNTLLKNLEKILIYTKDSSTTSNSLSLFGTNDISNKEIELEKFDEVNTIQKLAWEKEFMGVYSTGNPLQFYDRLGDRIQEVKTKSQNEEVVMQVIVEKIKKVNTRSGKMMNVATLEDVDSQKIDGIYFPQEKENFEDFIVAGRAIVIKGKTRKKEDETTIIIDDVRDVVYNQ